MSLLLTLETVVRPFLSSIGTQDIEAKMQSLEVSLRSLGAAVPSIAAQMEPDDLQTLGLPSAVCKVLAGKIREDSLSSAASIVGADPHTNLRPASFDQVIGHGPFKILLTRAILASHQEKKAMRHILLTGPRGLGKTTLALAIAHESTSPIRLLAGTQLARPQDVTTQVLSWSAGEIIFIDEIHGMSKAAQETLYSVMEDRRLPVSENRRGGRVQTSVPAPDVTIIGATTNPSKLLPPFLNRFGIKRQLEFYSTQEMGQIGQRSCRLLGFALEEEGLGQLITHSRDNPRTLNEFLIQLSDLARSAGRDKLTLSDVTELLELNDYKDGLSRHERTYLETLKQMGGVVGLTTLAQALDMEAPEVEQSVEPWLVRTGRIRKTVRGRQLNLPTSEDVAHA
ncbi:MAG: AAA family ATPase [Dehalococcoidia bacterium]